MILRVIRRAEFLCVLWVPRGELFVLTTESTERMFPKNFFLERGF